MDYMRHALSLAKLALGHTSPNPAVGAVVVRDGVVVGEGYTQPPWSHHAEVVALQQAGEKARHATMYVTLEPCCFQGRTPPCTQAIVAAGIDEVHLAMIDPNPKVSGRGKAELEAAGIGTHLGEHEHEAQELNEAYVKFMKTGMPFVTGKFAMSLDGKIATRTGDSRWISGEESRRYVHCLRYQMDALMVGVDTIITDDPQLTARVGREGGQVERQPLRVVVDSQGRTPLNARVLQVPGKTLIAVAEGLEPANITALSLAGAEVVTVPAKEGLVDLDVLLRILGQRGITSIMVEGGAGVFGSLFEYRLVDKVIAFIAPIIIGGEAAKNPVKGRGVEKVAQAMSLTGVKVEKIGKDVMISGYADR
ncbi:MAG: bifunctional diaminohydroxyphosphoribosylaminopyrimidine deaminase/5-amino-6-(5-phosphoribosylamino)uracil reductase RibD [Chloroflexi bacterium]|nr:bifunctional diaminohydroxyphosphoribosylaminopyrimidine deaminase/5-amino-6-(5-phosphoribosylamino)uracil reductase RibD [Chloroflexota bacterium]